MWVGLGRVLGWPSTAPTENPENLARRLFHQVTVFGHLPMEPEPCRWWVSTRLIRVYSAPPTRHLCDFRWQAGCPYRASWPCVSFARADFIGAVLTIEILPQGSGFLPEIPAEFFALLSLNRSLGAKTKVLAARVLLPQARPVRAHVVWGDPYVSSCLPDSFAPWEGNAATFPGPSTKSYFLAF